MSSSAAPYTVRWGIMATGGIAETFCKDLLTNPASRGVHDVRHVVAAVASSSSKQRAVEFLRKIEAPAEMAAAARAYGSYAELVADADVDVVYVATPHSHHFQNAMLALEAGKPVLCEKALTVNAAQARKLFATARVKGLFFMEAVWTRYFPLSVKVRELVRSGAIGTVHRAFADLSLGRDAGDGVNVDFPDSNRMVNPALAGGALLDLGVYSLTWLFQTLYHVQPEAAKEVPQTLAAVDKYHLGADESTSILVHFPQHRATGIATTSMRVATDVDGRNTAGPAIRVQGTEGEIQVMGPAYRPTRYRVVHRSRPGEVEVVDCPIPGDEARGGWGHGMFWEADECARCLRDGRLESAGMPWEESIAVMDVMTEALRQGGVEYPDLITTDVYDPKSPLNVGNQ